MNTYLRVNFYHGPVSYNLDPNGHSCFILLIFEVSFFFDKINKFYKGRDIFNSHSNLSISFVCLFCFVLYSSIFFWFSRHALRIINTCRYKHLVRTTNFASYCYKGFSKSLEFYPLAHAKWYERNSKRWRPIMVLYSF